MSQMSRWSHDTSCLGAYECFFPRFYFIMASGLTYFSLAASWLSFPAGSPGLPLLSLAWILLRSISNPYMIFNGIGGLMERENWKTGHSRRQRDGRTTLFRQEELQSVSYRNHVDTFFLEYLWMCQVKLVLRNHPQETGNGNQTGPFILPLLMWDAHGN